MKKYTSILFVFIFIFSLFNIQHSHAQTTPAPTIYTGASTAGKIKFIKQVIKEIRDNPNSTIWLKNIVAIKDKFVIDAHCGGPNPNLWTVKEDGSAIISARDGCTDSHNGLTGVQYGHGNIHSRILLNWGSTNGDFVHEVLGTGVGQSAICIRPDNSDDGCDDDSWRQTNHSVYYEMLADGSIEVRSISPIFGDIITQGFVVLKNRLITPTPSIAPTPEDGKLLGLPDWNIIRSTGPLPKAVYVFGFGDFMIEKPLKATGWKVYKIALDGTRTLFKTLPIAGDRNNSDYVFDNSVWPPKLAIMERNVDSTYRVSVYKLTTDDIVLDKTINLPSSFPRPPIFSSDLNKSFAVWNDYVIVPHDKFGTELKQKIELWKSGQKLDEITTFDTSDGAYKTVSVAVSQGGYLAITTDQKDNAAYIYKLDVTGNPLAPPAQLQLKSLRLGSKGEAVRQLQLALGLSADGSFGPLTKQAVIAFQKTNNLTADGVAGALTQAILLPLCKKDPAPTPPPTPPVFTPLATIKSTPPVISAIEGQKTLKINEQGTWTAGATDANNDDLAWSVNFGEGKSVLTCKENPSVGTAQNSSYAVSNGWTKAGTYTVTMYANDCKGGATSKSITVTVK